MPLKIEMEINDFDVNGEPLYDWKALEAYCEQCNKAIEELSEEEKKPFIIGYMSL